MKVLLWIALTSLPLTIMAGFVQRNFDFAEQLLKEGDKDGENTETDNALNTEM